jgi:hypothetical protein
MNNTFPSRRTGTSIHANPTANREAASCKEKVNQLKTGRGIIQIE